ncbi:hypothetical protein GmHk_14G041263 [Glycine max]|nr:hypothetical protein GmHk_14G041263 [Glycine max]
MDKSLKVGEDEWREKERRNTKFCASNEIWFSPLIQDQVQDSKDPRPTSSNGACITYGLPPDFTPRATPEDLSQAPTFEGQLPPYDDYPGQDDEEGDTHLGPLLHLKDPSPHELPQPNIVRHIPASPTPVKESVPFAEDKGKIEALEERASAQHTAPAAPRPINNTAPGATYKYAQHPPPKDNFPPIPMAHSELWPSLLENHLVVAIHGKVLQPPYPKWYDPEAKCVYHSGVPGHNIDSCIPFKYKVQHLISADWLSFQEEGLNVKTNPLASHGGASMNAVEEDGPSRAKRLGEVATSRRFIYQSLQAACMVSRGGDERDECLFHLGESHDIETCSAVEELLQRLMDCGQLESEEKKVPLTPKALVICFTRKGTGSTPIYPRAAPKPTPFAYQSNRTIPWKYTPPASSERVATEVDSLSAKVTSITGLSGVTRSGRVFASPHPAELPSKGKAPIVQEPTDIATPSKEVDPPVGRGAEKKEGLQGKTVTLEEAHEFLRLIQQSEFKVVEQLNKTPARISLLELLINSEPHRALLMKVLNDAHVAHDISVEGFEGIVNHITTNNYIAFAEEEIPVEGRGHNKALHVSVRCMDHIVAKVLIDNGSSLNVMPKTTLEKLPFSARLKPSSMVVRAFDGTRREVMGEIDIPIQIGPHTCNVMFQVMDINPAYSCLLGRPWIHALGVVPSTLHQKLKFAVGGLLVIVSGEEHMLVSCPSSAPYVEAAEESLETAFQSFEVVSCASVEPSSSLPSLSKAAIMVARVMLKNGFEPGMGLGKDCLGNADVVDIKGNPYKYGLGYEPGMPGRRNVPSRFRVDRVWPGRISQCFTSAGMVSEEEVAAIEEEFPQDPPSFVQPCHPDSQVGNWRVISQYEGRFFEDPNNEGLTIDFDRDISQTINKEEEEDVLSPELERLVAQEEREMRPHQEETELVNLGTTEEKKEVKVGTGMTAPIRQGLITLLEEYQDEMAPRKLASKRSRKDKVAEGTNSAPEYDSHRFRSAEHQQRFKAIKGWSFLRERRVQLRNDEYTDFQEEIVRRRWASLVTPMAKFDPDIRQVQGDAPQAADAPPPHQAGPAGLFDKEQYLWHLVRQQVANHRAHVQTHDCFYQMSLSLQSQGFTSFPCPTPDQFRAEVAWPGDWPEARAGEAPAEAPAEAPDETDEAREDEEMTNLLDFLGGSGAT